MQHAKKMALIPHSFVDQLIQKQQQQEQLISNTPIVELSALDKQLQQVLNDTTLPSDKKAVLYASILNRYNAIRNNVIQPAAQQQRMEIPDVEQPLPNVDVTMGLSKQYVKRANALKQHLDQIPELQWDNKNQLVHHGTVIQGSNIIDLIHAFVKPASKDKPSGWKELRQIIMDNNVPQSFVTNKRLLSDSSDTEMYDTPHEVNEPDPVTPVPTPQRTIYSRKLKGVNKKWSPQF